MRLGLFGSAAPRVARRLAAEPQIEQRDMPDIMPPPWLMERARAQGFDPMLALKSMQEEPANARPVAPANNPMPSSVPPMGMFGGARKKAMSAAQGAMVAASGKPSPIQQSPMSPEFFDLGAGSNGSLLDLRNAAARTPGSGISMPTPQPEPATAPTMGGAAQPQVKYGVQAGAQDMAARPQTLGAFGNGPSGNSFAAKSGMQNQQPNFFEGMIGYNPNQSDLSGWDYFWKTPEDRALSKERVATAGVEAQEKAELARQRAEVVSLYGPQAGLAFDLNPEQLGSSLAGTFKSQTPQVFSTSKGLVSVTDGKPELIYGTEPEDKPQNLPPGMWYNPETKQPDWIPGYKEGYRDLHPPSASSSGTKPPSGFQWVDGPDGPSLAPIPGGPADRGLNMNPQFIQMELQQSKDWKGVYNNFSDINDQAGRIRTMAARKDPAGDLALVVSFTKMLDPGSVAREGEVALTQSAASALQQAQNWLPRLQQGGTKLPDELREALLSAGEEMYGVYERKYHEIAGDYTARAKAYGFAPERVLLGYRPPKPNVAPRPDRPGTILGGTGEFNPAAFQGLALPQTQTPDDDTDALVQKWLK